MKWIPTLCVSGLLVCGMAQGETATQQETTPQQIERGRYLVALGGCNDCHTPGFATSDGDVPENQHLLGSDIGYSGPWGVSYAGNLRLSAAAMTADQWRARARAGGLPPMPWPSLRAMTDGDLDAVHAYLLHLGPAGKQAPPTLAPGQPITTMHFIFVPQPAD